MSDTSVRFCVAGIHSKQPWFVLSAARHFSLYASDNPAISHYYGFEAGASAAQTFAIPDGCVDILFDCNDSRPTARICGTTLAARNAHLSTGHRYFGVRFVPGVIPDFLDVSADELVDHEINLLDAAPVLQDTFEQIVAQPLFARQVELFRRFYNGKTPRAPSALTSQALREICTRKGNIRVKQLEQLTGYSSRTLQRQFQNDMGMSPKAFSQIIRCQSAVYDINHSKDVAFSELACDLGFSDQSHFLREFKKFVAATPFDYQKQIRDEAYLGRIRYQ